VRARKLIGNEDPRAKVGQQAPTGGFMQPGSDFLGDFFGSIDMMIYGSCLLLFIHRLLQQLSNEFCHAGSTVVPEKSSDHAPEAALGIN
jgi:hypothetical protein